MKYFLRSGIVFFFLALCFSSCEKPDDDTSAPVPAPSDKKFVLKGTIRQMDQNGMNTMDSLDVYNVKLIGTSYSMHPDANGNFRFEQLAPGNYQLEIKKLGYGDFVSPVIVLNNSSSEFYSLGQVKMYQIPGFDLTSFSASGTFQPNGFMSISCTTSFNSTFCSRNSMVFFSSKRDINIQDTSSYSRITLLWPIMAMQVDRALHIFSTTWEYLPVITCI